MDDMTDAEFDRLLSGSSVGRKFRNTRSRWDQPQLTGMEAEQADWEEGSEEDGNGEL